MTIDTNNEPLILPSPRPPRRFRPVRLLLRLCALALVAGLIGLAYLSVTNVAFRQAMGGVLAGANPRAAFGQDAVTLMVLGKDEDRDNRARVMETNARSDTIMMARMDFAAKSIDILSVPRDTRVRIPGVRGYRKINSAHSIGGPDLTARTLEKLLGVAPQKSLVVDYDLLRQVIDDIGGVTVNVDRKLDYDDNWGNLHIHLKPGLQTLNGRDAMGFVRFRHSNDGAADSDIVRIGRQQALLQALKAKLKEPATWVRVPAVLQTVRREMRGSLTYPQLVALANFARSVPKENVRMHVLPSRPGRVFVYPNRTEIERLVARVFRTAAAPPVPEPAQTPRAETPRARRERRPERSAIAPEPPSPALPAPAARTEPAGPPEPVVVQVEEEAEPAPPAVEAPPEEPAEPPAEPPREVPPGP